ncbi:MAG: hypothetical protein HY608_10340, partial [Planctomycetes bacterium]|nr:hypothetical protein [Planctomycetota bacterium]
AYDARIDASVGQIRQAVDLIPTDAVQARAILERVRADLQALNQENPPRGTAVLVEQWALFWSGIEPDYSNFPWEEGLERLTHDIFGKLESHRYTTPAVRDLIGQQRQWIESQLSDKEEVLRVLRLVNGTTEGEWKQALAQLDSLPAGTLFAETVRSRGPELRARIFALHEAKARDAFGRQAWAQVRPEADAARPWGDAAQAAELDAMVAEAAAEAGFQALVEQARQALQRGIAQSGFDPARVIEVASSVPAGSRYHAAAREILETAESFRFAREVQNLFNQGPEGAQRALARMDAAGQNPGGIRNLIEQTVSRWEKAQRHLSANEYDEAVQCWGDIVGRLDAGLYGMNMFRQEAEALRRQWSDPRRQAGEFHRLGTEAREARRYAEAVAWFERSVEKDPSHVRGTDELSAMEREARRLVGEASGGISANPVADIRRALEMVPAGFPDRRRWEEEWRRIGGR